MPKDFAKSRQRKTAAKPAASRRRTPRASIAPASTFSLGSFLAGAAVGVAGVLIVLNGLEMAPPEPAGVEATANPTASVPEFVFFDELPSRGGPADARPYEYPAADVDSARSTSEFLLQAGSFRDKDDAERLRANLTLEGLEVDTIEAALTDGVWYRVLVGPFASRRESERAKTRLRQYDIAPLLLERATNAG